MTRYQKDAAMHEKLARAILTLAREIRECAASGECPQAAVRAAVEVYSVLEGLLLQGCDVQAEYALVTSVRGALEYAVQVHAVDQDRASEVLLPRELHRLRGLVARAEEAVKAEEVCA